MQAAGSSSAGVEQNMCVLKTTGTIICIKYIQKRLKNIFYFDCGNLIEVQRKSVLWHGFLVQAQEMERFS